jgi:hypothetical protein
MLEAEADGPTIQRTLPVSSPFFYRYLRRRKVVELEPKPPALSPGAVDERTWRRYQAYLSRVPPIARADFYARLMQRTGAKSIRALARITGEDWSRVARILKLKELPEPVLECLRAQHDPGILRFFTEKRLHTLLRYCSERRIWAEFRALIEEARDSSGGGTL